MKPLYQSKKKIDVTGLGIKPMGEILVKWPTKHHGFSVGTDISVIVHEIEDIYNRADVMPYSTLYIQEIDDTTVTTTNLDWYTFLKNNHQRELSVDEMSPIINGIHRLIKDCNFNYLNDILLHTLTSASSPESIVCMLRATFSVKEKLANWKELLNKSKSWLQERGRNINQDLVGLI